MMIAIHDAVWLYGSIPEQENTEIVSMDMILDAKNYNKVLKLVGKKEYLIEYLSSIINDHLESIVKRDQEPHADFIANCAELKAEEGSQ